MFWSDLLQISMFCVPNLSVFSSTCIFTFIFVVVLNNVFSGATFLYILLNFLWNKQYSKLNLKDINMHFNLPIVEVVRKKESLWYNCREVIMFLALYSMMSFFEKFKFFCEVNEGYNPLILQIFLIILLTLGTISSVSILLKCILMSFSINLSYNCDDLVYFFHYYRFGSF